jgi:hypothetical protein
MGKKKNALILPQVFFGSEVVKFKEEAYAKGRFDGFVLGSELVIKTIHERAGYSAEQIASITGFLLDYVQSTIDKCEKKA